MPPVIVKLGGSLAFSEVLIDWLRALASCAGHVVIVPGGGPFADAVRVTQHRMGFDDRTAHHIALLAMEQYGRALISFSDLLSPAEFFGSHRKASLSRTGSSLDAGANGIRGC